MATSKKLTRSDRDSERKEGIILGNLYRDTITGVEGVAVAHYFYLTGCDQVSLCFVPDKEPKYWTVDSTRLVDAETGEAAPSQKKPGGPENGPRTESRAVRARDS